MVARCNTQLLTIFVIQPEYKLLQQIRSTKMIDICHATSVSLKIPRTTQAASSPNVRKMAVACLRPSANTNPVALSMIECSALSTLFDYVVEPAVA